jgi:hypothetical protein
MLALLLTPVRLIPLRLIELLLGALTEPEHL